jgi:hypothetical protein
MNQTISLHSSHKNDYTMISLNIPKYLKTNIDDLIKFKRISRTSMLINLMESYLRTELLQMKKDNDLSESFKLIKDKFSNPKPTTKEKPMIPHSDDVEWEDRLSNL